MSTVDIDKERFMVVGDDGICHYGTLLEPHLLKIRTHLKAELLAKMPKEARISTDERWDNARNNTIREITKLIEEL